MLDAILAIINLVSLVAILVAKSELVILVWSVHVSRVIQGATLAVIHDFCVAYASHRILWQPIHVRVFHRMFVH